MWRGRGRGGPCTGFAVTRVVTGATCSRWGASNPHMLLQTYDACRRSRLRPGAAGPASPGQAAATGRAGIGRPPWREAATVKAFYQRECAQ